MKPRAYKELEKDRLFKRYYLSKTIWWNSFSFIPPALVLFTGLAGIIFMTHNDQVMSWYTIPYLIIFILGAIWFKIVKNHVQDKHLSDSKKFLVCASRFVGNRYGYYYFIFSTGERRHDESWIKKISESIDIDSLGEDQLKSAKKQVISVRGENGDKDLCIKGFQINKVMKSNSENLDYGITPLLYISTSEMFVIRNKDLKGK